VCRAEEAEEVSRTLVRECRNELKKADAIRVTIDPTIRKKMRTLYVAQTILSIQRDAVCSLAKRGLVSNKEKEVLLEEVLEDLEEVFKLEEDRGHEQHGGEHGGVEHWVDAAHTLPSQDVEAHLSARPADAARMTLANSRLFGANGAYASARARVGDTRRILGLRNSGEEAEWCGAHMATTRRRMDRISTVAPPTSYESTSRDETVDETN